jgi:hypothetical protein
MAGGGSRGIHAARPTPRHLRSACTQVAICVVWDIAHLETKSKANAALGFHPNPVGDAGGHDGSEAVGQPGRYLLRYRFVRSRPGLSHSSSSSHRVPYTAGNLDTPRNSGAADRALANARSVSPSASYLKGHQVTKCPGSRLGASFVSVPSLRRRSVGPPPSMPLGPLRDACAQPAPKSRFVSSGLTRA